VCSIANCTQSSLRLLALGALDRLLVADGDVDLARLALLGLR
jgi:hypothetical protein